ncbi:hypothetical protein ACQRXC_28700 (plasmid) [Niallia taxi]|uniref:hypothetical protein n=1 Tax=Niallia TaxID=2837506 RepID=UPI002174F742|nr:hypothetical protein [Niallia taxi]MED4057163.1 hypothetical protein [Niallia taxi]MED4122149.1 hypothetical protein [Niallia taxi]
MILCDHCSLLTDKTKSVPLAAKKVEALEGLYLYVCHPCFEEMFGDLNNTDDYTDNINVLFTFEYDEEIAKELNTGNYGNVITPFVIKVSSDDINERYVIHNNEEENPFYLEFVEWLEYGNLTEVLSESVIEKINDYYQFFEGNRSTKINKFIIEEVDILPYFYEGIEKSLDNKRKEAMEKRIEKSDNKEPKKLKKYRLGYDNILLPKKSFIYKNNYIGAMSFDLLFKVYDEEGNEKLFESEELIEQYLQFNNGNSCCLSDLVSCSFDNKSIIKFKPNVPLLKESGYKVKWEIDSYWKDIDKGVLESEEISESEFMDILNSNKELFDNSNNYSAQSTAYFTREVTI